MKRDLEKENRVLKDKLRALHRKPPHTVRLINEIFVFGEGLYLMNSRKSVVENSTFCLRHLFRVWKEKPAI